MSIVGIAHIGYVVKSMESSLKRFEREGARLLVPVTEDPVQKVFVCLLELRGEGTVELVSPVDESDCPINARLARGGGLDHICFFSDDVEADLKEEEKNGALILQKPVHAVAFGKDVAFALRRSGLVVEFMSV